MRRFSILFRFSALLVIALTIRTARAQDDPNFEAGMKPYGTYHGGNIDTIDLSNGSLAVDIPLMSYPQRGGTLNLDFALHYENRGSFLDQECYTDDSGDGYCWYQGPTEIGHGFSIIQKGAPLGGYLVSDFSYPNAICLCGFGGAIQMSDGPVHSINPISLTNWESTPTSWESADGSSYQATIDLATFNPFSGGSAGVITGPDGTRYQGGNLIPGPYRPSQNYLGLGIPDLIGTPTSIEDVNGNEITYSSSTGWTDSVGRSIPVPVSTSTSNCPSGPLTPTSAWIWHLPGVTGVNSGDYPILFCSVTITETLEQSDGWTWMAPVSYSATELQSVVLPNGTAWTFQYTSDGNGDLQQITFPTGGSLAYTWTSPFQLAFTHSYVNLRGVATRTLNDGINSSQTTYTYPRASGITTLVTDGAGNDTVHTFSDVYDLSFFETESKFYQGSYSGGTLLKTVDTTYWRPTINSGQAFPSQVTTTWPNGQQGMITYTYDSALTANNNGYLWEDGSVTYTGTTTMSYGKELTKSEYDYGSGAPGSLIKTTTTSYLALSNSSYLNNNLLALPSSIQVTDSGSTQRAYTTYSYDGLSLDSSGISTQHDSSPPAGSYRGNLTSTSRWLNVTSGYLTNYKTYYDTGMIHKSVDASGSSATDSSHMTTYTYDSTGTFPTQIQHPATGSTAHVENFTYDVTPGLMLTHSDQNSQTTTYTYNDFMERLTNVAFPDGGNVGYCYKDKTADSCSPSSTVPYYVFTKKITSSSNFQEVGKVDGVGRIIQTQRSDGSCSYVYVNTSYDALGRKAFVSNPSCSSSVSTGTSYQYDALSRVTMMIPADGSTSSDNVTTSYTGGCSTVTDEAGKARKSCTDGLGRMTGVWEDPSGLNYETDYAYDALDNLTSVTQSSSRGRTFSYDSLSRLVSASNPESGTICYGTVSGTCQQNGYDGNGNLIYKTDARGITTSYTYDALNRLMYKTYSDGSPSAYYYYDQTAPWSFTISNPIGRLTEQGTYNGSSYTTLGIRDYDPMGRVKDQWYGTPINMGISAWVHAYTYDLFGDLTSYTDGMGNTITQGFDAAAHLTQITSSLSDSQHPGTLVSGITYWPGGQMNNLTYANGLTEASYYNTRMQPCRMNVNSSSSALSSCGGSAPSGNVQDFQYGFNYGSSDNGNVVSWNGSGQQTFTRSYSYDNVNRISGLSDSTSGNPCPGLSWSYDNWGNLTAKTVTSGSCGSWSQSYNGSNQITGFTYDAAGNMTYDGSHHYSYDAEERLVAVDGGATAAYTYDAEGKRVEKVAGSTTIDYLYSLDGHVITEATSGGGWNAGYVYAGGQLVAEYANSTTRFVHPDHLGSTRLMTNVSGSVCESNDFLPFGESNGTSGSCSTTHEFTGKERDSESGLDNFGARYYSSQYGRFMVPDWSAKATAVPYADFGNPQTLNLYAMVHNNPISLADLDGHQCYGNAEPGCVGGTPPAQNKNNGIIPGTSQPAALQAPKPPAEAYDKTPGPDYKEGVPKATGALQNTVACVQTCSGQTLTVTSTNEQIPQHPADSPHGKGEAADLRVAPGTEGRVLACAAQCGAQFGLNERTNPSAQATGPHVHIQIVPGTNGGRGDLPPDN